MVLRSVPGKLNHLLGISTRDLEKVIYYEAYIVINPGSSDKKRMELIDENEYRELESKFGKHTVSEEDQDEDNYFYADMGGMAVRNSLKTMDTVSYKHLKLPTILRV